MSIEEKQNLPTAQDSDSIKYPQNEREVSSFIKKFYKSNIPIELESWYVGEFCFSSMDMHSPFFCTLS